MAIKSVAVTGGIGAGKSVVCSILRHLGYNVYDCDHEAKTIMDSSESIKESIKKNISSNVIDPEGKIDRKGLAKIVFADSALLSKLNEIVHGAVREHLLQNAAVEPGIFFFETAILCESGFDNLADEIWTVTAPKEIRIIRACSRDNVSADEIIRRIESQSDCYNYGKRKASEKIIINDGIEPLLPQVLALI